MISPFSALPLLGITDFFGDMGFVVRLMVFAYMLFWLFITFRENQFIFGLSAIVLFFFLFMYGVSTVIAIVLLMTFLIFGNHIQMVVQFAILQTSEQMEHKKMVEFLNKDYALEELDKMVADGKISPRQAQEYISYQQQGIFGEHSQGVGPNFMNSLRRMQGG